MIFPLSGGANLNYKVIGSASQPATTTENAIWIKTDVKIASYIFASTEPQNPRDGALWIQAGNFSARPFNALKKDVAMVYVLRAFQYVDGAWAEKDISIYQDGAWRSFEVFLFNNGDLGVSGGFACINSNGSDASSRLTIGNTITLNRVQYSQYGIYSNNKIDVTDFSVLNVDCYSAAYIGDGSRMGVGLSVDTAYENFAVKSSVTMSRKVHEIDISALQGEYHFVMWHYVYGSMSAGDSYIYSIELIPK